ncbi:hypothetical protein ACFL4K_02755 [Candidatus Neomarinimicrobiota bacterium]
MSLSQRYELPEQGGGAVSAVAPSVRLERMVLKGAGDVLSSAEGLSVIACHRFRRESWDLAW